MIYTFLSEPPPVDVILHKNKNKSRWASSRCGFWSVISVFTKLKTFFSCEFFFWIASMIHTELIDEN